MLSSKVLEIHEHLIYVPGGYFIVQEIRRPVFYKPTHVYW